MIKACLSRVRVRNLCIGTLAGVAFAASSAAAPVTPVGKYRDWRVDTQEVDGDLVCFASTSATDKAPGGVQHGTIHFFVANWKSGAAAGQPSLRVGYDMREELPPTAKVGNKSWRMYAVGREAFFEKDDKAVISALKAGSRLRVEAVSKRGTETTYTFSLSGSSAAISAAEKACQ